MCIRLIESTKIPVLFQTERRNISLHSCLARRRTHMGLISTHFSFILSWQYNGRLWRVSYPLHSLSPHPECRSLCRAILPGPVQKGHTGDSAAATTESPACRFSTDYIKYNLKRGAPSSNCIRNRCASCRGECGFDFQRFCLSQPDKIPTSLYY